MRLPQSLKCAQTWITQFYLQITPCLTLLPSRRASPPFGWYSFYRPTECRRLSRPGWLVTYRNKVPPPGVEPGHGHHPRIPTDRQCVGRGSNPRPLSRKSDALTTSLASQPVITILSLLSAYFRQHLACRSF